MKTFRTFFYCMFPKRLLPFKIVKFFLLLFVVSSVFLLGAERASACMASWGDGIVSSCADYKGVYIPGEKMIFTEKVNDTANRGVAAYISFPFDMATYTGSTGVVPGYIASCTDPTSCTATATPNAPATPGTYTVDFRPCATFEKSGYLCISTFVSIFVRDVGNINVSSNIPSYWTITGPATFTDGTNGSSTNGLGSYSSGWPGEPSGMYTITWGAKSGYVTPATQTLTLGSGGTISFRGTYLPAPVMSGTLSITPSPCIIGLYESSCHLSLSWVITNPEGKTSFASSNPGGLNYNGAADPPSFNTVMPVVGEHNPTSFYLYNNSKLLTQTNVVVKCIAGTAWDGVCRPIVIPAPTLTLSAAPNPVAYNAASTLSWTTSNATSCWATNGWTGWKTNTGDSESTGALTAAKTYSLQCWNSAGVSTGVKTVTVNLACTPDCDEVGSHCPGVTYNDGCGNPTCTNGTLPQNCPSGWGSCSKSCGGGIQTRICACPPENQTQICNSQPCPPGYRDVAPW